MTTEQILTRVNEAIAEFDSHVTPRATLADLASDLESQLRIEIAASKGVGNATRTIVAMLKSQEQGRLALAYPWIDDEGRQCVCDGYQAFRLRNHLPLPERPENIGPGINLTRFFPASTSGWKPLPMPSAKELRAFISVERAKTGRRKNFEPVWDFGPHAPSVNALRLLNAATLFPDAEKIFWNTLVSPLFISGKAGDGIVLPIRVQDKTQEAPANDEERKAIEAEKLRNEENRKADMERSKIIRKAHDDYDAAQEASKSAQLQKAEALHKAQKADDECDDAAKCVAMQAYYGACTADATYRLQGYAARSIFDPTFTITPADFEWLIKNLYMCDTHNAA